MPTSAAGVGQWTKVMSNSQHNTGAIYLPSGGTWLWFMPTVQFVYDDNAGSVYTYPHNPTGIHAGGTNLNTATILGGLTSRAVVFCWRIS